jgi:hypothetical protein
MSISAPEISTTMKAPIAADRLNPMLSKIAAERG